MSTESHHRLRLAYLTALGTAVAVFAVGGGWDATALALVGGVATALVARINRDAAPSPVPSAPPAPTLPEVLDAVADPVLLVADGRVVLANTAARAVLGRHVVGEDARVAIRHPAAAEAIAQGQEQALELVGIGGQDRRWRLRVAATSAGLTVVTLHDRTENAAAERMRVDFVANASHELRTPLASILGYAETLSDDAGEEPALRKRFLQIMMDEARRMQRVVEDLLSLSRIEAGKFRQPDTAVGLAGLLAEVCAELRATGDARAQDVVCEGGLTAPSVLGDRAQLSQVLHNLVGNAMKYGRPGTPVFARVEPIDTGVRFSVNDQGDGIAAEHIPRLTERFYRVDAGRSRAMGGTGLGLAIVKHIVERHRGRLDIASRVGVGTTIAITLPAGPA